MISPVNPFPHSVFAFHHLAPYHHLPQAVVVFCQSRDSRSSGSRRRRRRLRSLCITGRIGSFHSLDEVGVVDGDPAAAGELEPVEEGQHDHHDDDYGDDYEDGFHARRRGLGGLLWKRERGEGMGGGGHLLCGWFGEGEELV